MQMRQDISQQTRQVIALTPQVIQSIKLLKCDHEELLAYLRAQEERNPLIEIIANESELSSKSSVEAKHLPNCQKQSEDREGQARHVKTNPQSTQSQVGYSYHDPLRQIEETQSKAYTLREHLLKQVQFCFSDKFARIIAVEIVEAVDPDGYLRQDLEDIADRLNTSMKHVLRVLNEVQQFEPAGVAARSIAECLALQLKEQGQLTPKMSKLLANLPVLARSDMTRLARLCEVDANELAEMVHTIRSLQPHPGYVFDSEPTLPALPDIKLNMAADDSFQLELNSEILPKVLVNREYLALVKSQANGDGGTKFIVDCLHNANWLVKSLDKRANTILKVATEIVKRQTDFFLYGVDHMKPLNQADIANATGLHRSTICRATSNKYIMTNRGMFELKYFFSNAIACTSSDDEVSTASIRARIQTLVENESKENVLSDEAIMKLFQEDGIDIARRTVAKYRDILNIPSSQVRRHQKRIEALDVRYCAEQDFSTYKRRDTL